MKKNKLVKIMIPIVVIFLVLSMVSSAQTFSGQDNAVYSNQEQIFKTNQNHPIGFVEPGPIELVTDPTGRTYEVPTELVWMPMVGSDTSTLTNEDFQEMVQSLKNSRIEDEEPEQQQGSDDTNRAFNLVLDTHGSWPAAALTALDQVEWYLENTFYDPITVEIDLYYQSMGGGVLGSTSVATAGSVSWTNTRSRLISDMDSDDWIQDYLPSGSSIPVRYNGGSSSVTNEYSCYFAKANYKAIGYSITGAAGSTTFNSDFNWDFDPSNGVPGYKYCFQSVAVHEFGHALGFISRAEEWYQDNNIFALDIFRFEYTDETGNENPDTVSEFQTVPRLVDWNNPQDDHASVLFEDPGGFPDKVQYRMADGYPDQASHFRWNVNGIMDPDMAGGESFYPNFYQTADLDMFDAIGWDYIPGGGETDPPEPNPMTWDTLPYPTSSSSISMVATTAADASPPIHYYFESPDGHSSGWQASPIYTDTGLLANTEYTYRVKARDYWGNDGDWSSYQSTFTHANIPGAPVVTNPTPSTLDVDVTPVGIQTSLEEGFETGLMPPPGGWTTIDNHPSNNWEIVAASSEPDLVHTGDYAAVVRWDHITAQDEWLISPDIELPVGLGYATLSFWANCWTLVTGATVKVWIYGDGFNDEIWDMQEDEDWPDNPSFYREVVLDLTPYLGEIITIKWQYVGITLATDFAMDDILVISEPLSRSQTTVEFAILCNSTTPYDSNWEGKYVDSIGGSSATEIWQTDDNWGITTITGLQESTQYCFKVKARNDEGVETEFGPVGCNVTEGSGNQPPVVSDIPDQTINEGETFTTFDLDDYVYDPDNSDAEISWTWTGESELTVDYNAVTHIVDILIPNPEWSDSETITFRATDPGFLWGEDAATFTVNAVNDPPVVSDIPDQTINEGETFTTITLDDYVTDVDNTDDEMDWTYSGNTELIVDIDVNRIATITIPNPDWYGNELITFTATDPGLLFDSDTARFIVNAVNDPPVVSDIPDQNIQEGESFTIITLDDYVTDIDNTDDEMDWTYSGNTELIVDIDVNRIATITTPSPNWVGSETITFRATDPGFLWDEDPATFIVTALPTYTLTISIEGMGIVTTDPVGTSFPEGTVVTMEGIPNENWRHHHWSGDLDTIENPTLIIMDTDKTITAHFWRIGDTDGNGIVNVQDFLYLLSVWGSDDHDADFNDDGVVNVSDFLALLANWG